MIHKPSCGEISLAPHANQHTYNEEIMQAMQEDFAVYIINAGIEHRCKEALRVKGNRRSAYDFNQPVTYAASLA